MDTYPVSFGVDYQDRPLNRLTSFFRFLTVIPIAILLASVTGAENTYSAPATRPSRSGCRRRDPLPAGAADDAVPAQVPALVVRLEPRARAVHEPGRRLLALLMDDRYPSTDERQAVALDFPYPDVEAELSRGMPLVKWLLALPHYIVLFFLWIGAFFAVVVAWFAILFTGRYPRGLFDFVEGVLRWHNRVVGYAFPLVTDRYPPFRLSP